MSKTHQRPTDRIDFWSEVREVDAVDEEKIAALRRLAFGRESLSCFGFSKDKDDGESIPFRTFIALSGTKNGTERDDGVTKAFVAPRQKQHKAATAMAVLLGS